MSELNIYQRIHEVMKVLKYVQKDKHIKGGGQDYKAVTHDQVVSVARSELVKNGIMIYPEQLSSKMIQERDLSREIKMHLYSGDYAIHFVNIDKPDDRISVTINAHATDNGDKAPGKAVTYATKTAILKVLCLETGENDESRVKDQETISETQVQQLLVLVDAAGLKLTDFCDSAKIESLDEMQAYRFKPAKAHLNKLKAKKEEAEPDDS
jgi:hypothetical protein